MMYEYNYRSHGVLAGTPCFGLDHGPDNPPLSFISVIPVRCSRLQDSRLIPSRLQDSRLIPCETP